VLDAAVAEGGERAGLSDRGDEVAVPGGVRRRPAVLAEEVAVVGQPERDGLREPEWLGHAEQRHVRTRLLVGLEARHQRDGHLDVQRLRERSRLAELPGEEAAAVERLDRALHDAAEARRHAAREDRLGDAARGDRLDARISGGGPLLGAVSRKRGELRVVGRLDDALHDVRGR
jgi:hypothetical protein